MRKIMMQDGQVISHFVKQLNEAQMKYPTTEQELLVIMDTLKLHHNIINDGEIIIKTGHKSKAHDTAQ